MSSTTRSGAVYGIGTYGSAVYGVSNVTFVPDGVIGTITSDSGVFIIGDSNHVVVSLVAPALEGTVGVVGVAVTSLVGVSATAFVNDNVTFSLGCIFDVSGNEAAVDVGSLNVVAKAVTSLVGIENSTAIGSVVVLADANILTIGAEAITSLGEVVVKSVNRIPVDGVEAASFVGSLSVTGTSLYSLVGIPLSIVLGTSEVTADSVYGVSSAGEAAFSVGDVSISENARPTFVGLRVEALTSSVSVINTLFDFNAVANQYSLLRTVFVEDRASSADRRLLVAAENRTVYVELATAVNERTSLVGAESRLALVDRSTTSDDRVAKVA